MRTKIASRTTDSPPRRQRSINEQAALATAARGYAQLCDWRLHHAPWLLTPGGLHVFFQLIAAAPHKPVRLAELCSGAHAASADVRLVVQELQRQGYVTLRTDHQDRRGLMVESTAMLRRLAARYVKTMHQFMTTPRGARSS